MNLLSLNIKYLKEKEDLTEVEFGKLFGLNRGAVSSYINEGIKPKLETLQIISEKYNLTLDDLVNRDIRRILELENQTKNQYKLTEASNLITDPKVTLYTCPECVVKQKEIDSLKKQYKLLEENNSTLKELLAAYRNNAKKETKSASSKKVG